MRITSMLAGLSAIVAPIAQAPAQTPLPAPVRAMIEAAIAGDDEAEITAVAKYALRANPENGQEIRLLVDGWRAERAAITQREAQTRLLVEAVGAQVAAAEPPAEKPTPPWKGKVELGGFYATGNSDYVGITAGLNMRQEGEQWRHIVIAQGDYQESSGSTTRERFLLSYQPNYRFEANAYAYALGQYERDRFLGYHSRYAASAGLGYRLKSSDATVDIDVGPAYRLTDFTDGTQESSIAGRGSMTLDWKISPTLTFNQAAAVYVDSLNSTVSGTSALTAKVFGPLSMRLSYNVQYEATPPAGRETTDTLSRASIVYEF